MAPPDQTDGPLLSVIIPTYNESENIATLVPDILNIVGGVTAEVIVVDDNSPDGTAAVVQQLADSDGRVRLIKRAAKAGLSGAVFAGVQEASGSLVCVMDGDFSHDPEEIPQMLAKAQEGYDVVVGSRFAPGAAFVGQPLARRAMSYALNLMARVLLGIRTRDVLTGYAVMRREVLAGAPTRFSASGFKWLVEVLATQRGLRVHEWPIVFRDRRSGTSKANLREAVTFMVLCARLLVWRARHTFERG